LLHSAFSYLKIAERSEAKINKLTKNFTAKMS
jgi:hypothetical protein